MTFRRLRNCIFVAIAMSSITACPDGPTAPAVAKISINVSNYAPHVGDIVYVTGIAENSTGGPVPGVPCRENSQTPATAAVKDSLAGSVAALAAGTAVIRVTCGSVYVDVTLKVLAVSYDGNYSGSISGTFQPLGGGSIGTVNSPLYITVTGGQIVRTGNPGNIVTLDPPVTIPSSNITGESSMVTWTANDIILTGVFHAGTAVGNTAGGTWQFVRASGFQGGGSWQANKQ